MKHKLESRLPEEISIKEIVKDWEAWHVAVHGVTKSPANYTASLTSQRHRGKFPKVPCRSRGSSSVWREDPGLLSRPCRKRRPSAREDGGRRIDVFELWCWRRFLRVPWTTRRSNQSILKEISPEYSLEGLMLKLNGCWDSERVHGPRELP